MKPFPLPHLNGIYNAATLGCGIGRLRRLGRLGQVKKFDQEDLELSRLGQLLEIGQEYGIGMPWLLLAVTCHFRPSTT